MFSKEKFLEHFLPVLFTFVVCILLLFVCRIIGWIEHIGRQRSPRSQSIQLEARQKLSIPEMNSSIGGLLGDLKLTPNDQLDSPLFGTLPGEVRQKIYEFAFADFEDLDNPYDVSTCYRRPEYMGPRISDTALLSTCQAIYQEAWFLPWTSALHTFYFTANDRKPVLTTNVEDMVTVCRLIEERHPDLPASLKAVSRIQIFAQLCYLEPGARLNEILQIPFFMPKQVTITVRHTDIWFWEGDDPVFIRTNFVRAAKFPPSVTTIRFQIESLERRKPQIDYVAERASKEWFFTRTDGVHLVSTSAPNELQWTGGSTWGGARWIRDEDDAEPGTLRYYLVTLTFTPANLTDDAAGYATREARRDTLPACISVPDDIAAKSRIVQNSYGCIRESRLRQVGVTHDTPASEAVRIVREDDLGRRRRRVEWTEGNDEETVDDEQYEVDSDAWDD